MDREYKITITDTLNGDVLEATGTTYLLTLIAEYLDNNDPGTCRAFLSGHLEHVGRHELSEKLTAWYVCKTLPDTDNPHWQAIPEEIERLKVLC